jgi:threonine dehydratase
MRITAYLYDDYTDEDKAVARFLIERFGLELIDGTTKKFLIDSKGTIGNNVVSDLKNSGVFRLIVIETGGK